MLRQIAGFSLALGLFAAPVWAQNASEIASVQAGKSCQGCNLFQADLSYRDGAKMNLSGARLRQSSFALATYNDVDLSDANLSISNLFGARFNRTNFSNANLQSVSAVGTFFGASTLSGANLTGANLSGADLKLTRGLTQAQLNRACGDDSTQLPKGKTIPSCS